MEGARSTRKSVNWEAVILFLYKLQHFIKKSPVFLGAQTVGQRAVSCLFPNENKTVKQQRCCDRLGCPQAEQEKIFSQRFDFINNYQSMRTFSGLWLQGCFKIKNVLKSVLLWDVQSSCPSAFRSSSRTQRNYILRVLGSPRFHFCIYIVNYTREVAMVKRRMPLMFALAIVYAGLTE